MKQMHIRRAPPAPGYGTYRTAFNLFRRKREADLACAVPEDCPVPGFLDPSTWEYVGTLREPTTPLPGFNRRAAEASIRSNGFYLFEAGVTAPPPIADLALGCVIGAGARRPEMRLS